MEKLSKTYQVQARFGNAWVTVKTEQFHRDALDYLASGKRAKYPFRIVRVVRTVVFEEKK